MHLKSSPAAHPRPPFRPATLHGSKREARIAVHLLLVLTAGAYLPTPLYPGYQQAFGFTDLTMVLIYAVFALVSAPALLLFGPASDVLGRRSILRLSLLLAAIGSVCFLIADGPALLLVGRAAQGLALGAATGPATALIIESRAERQRLWASVLATMAFVGGTAAGPFAAGALAEYLPWPRLLPFVIHLGLLAIGWRRVSTLTAAPTQRLRQWRPTRPQVPHAMRHRFASAAATGFIAWTVAGVFLATIPTIITRATGTEHPAVTGGIVAVMLTCSMLVQPLVLRLSSRLAQLAGLGALLGSLVMLILTIGNSTALTLVAAVAAGIGHGFAYGSATASVDAATPAHSRGGVNAALYLAFYLGAGAPAVAVGLLTFWHPLPVAVAWLSAATAALIPVIAAAVIFTTSPHINRTVDGGTSWQESRRLDV
ncbi:MFS transporter [Arthrobacter castelli]|uniref:MFS transporter n=1 Tax=Arthrobacter castelli TaxID=271431 RepID=UPI0009D71B18|nr:MFS transporter [Arthrobacter castelli]